MILVMMRFFKIKKSLSLMAFLFACLWAIGAQGAVSAQTQLKQAYTHADRGHNNSALNVLGKIQSKDQNIQDDVALAQGRILFNKGEYAKAYKAYKKISKNSDHWLASVEERAWALIYLGKANQALADSHTLMSPLFRKVVSPEAFFLSAFEDH
jgi:tetratricopeptide (TPR) repeat protein